MGTRACTAALVVTLLKISLHVQACTCTTQHTRNRVCLLVPWLQLIRQREAIF